MTYSPRRQVLQGADRVLERGQAGLLCWPKVRLLEPLVVRLAHGLTSRRTSAVSFLQAAGTQLLASGLPPGTGVRYQEPTAQDADTEGAGNATPETSRDFAGQTFSKARKAQSKVPFSAIDRVTAIARARGIEVSGLSPAEPERTEPSGAGALREAQVRLKRLREDGESPRRRSGRLRAGPARRTDWQEDSGELHRLSCVRSLLEASQMPAEWYRKRLRKRGIPNLLVPLDRCLRCFQCCTFSV